MNFHKSIPILRAAIEKAKTKKEAEAIMSALLNSFKIQISCGVPELEAFENSIMNPSLKMSQKKTKEFELAEKNKKSKKFRMLFRYEEDVRRMKKQGVSNANIAKFINSHRVSNLGIKYNRQYIYQYCLERSIK